SAALVTAEPVADVLWRLLKLVAAAWTALHNFRTHSVITKFDQICFRPFYLTGQILVNAGSIAEVGTMSHLRTGQSVLGLKFSMLAPAVITGHIFDNSRQRNPYDPQSISGKSSPDKSAKRPCGSVPGPWTISPFTRPSRNLMPPIRA